MTLADVLPVDMVENCEKSREKDRRQITREEKILQQKEEHVSTWHCILRQSCITGLPAHKQCNGRMQLFLEVAASSMMHDSI